MSDPIPPSGEYPGLRHGHADLGSVRLHYVELGEGPLVVLLHGYPEFWYAWRYQIPALADAGFRVVAPDMRGYNRSSKPEGRAAYAIPRLTGDVKDLIAERGEDRAHLVGHDWGAIVSWWTAGTRPEVVDRLAILNVPHPRRMAAGLRTREQLRRSWYVFAFQLPWLPERLAQRHRWKFLRVGFEHDARAGAYTVSDIERYIEAWSQTGASTAMINYYRAMRPPLPEATRLGQIQAPTLVIWGERDRYIGRELAEPDRRDVPNLTRVVRMEHASHWVAADAPDEVSRLLVEHLSG